MSKFVTGTELTISIENVFRNATNHLYLFAPCMHLPDRLRAELQRKKTQDDLQVIIVFGKTDDDIRNSISPDDVGFLKGFPSIVISYAEHMNARYYANENSAVFTSLNLVDISQTSKLDAGVVLSEKGMLKQIAGSLTSTITETEKSSWVVANEFFMEALEKSKELYRNTPQYEKGFLNLSKKYSRSIVETNIIDEFIVSHTPKPTEIIQVEIKQEEKIIAPVIPVKMEDPFKPGYCIRTGYAMTFDPRNPLSAKALEEWRKDSDTEFPENYCHYSGEPSYGQTSVNRPVLQKNLKRAQEYKG